MSNKTAIRKLIKLLTGYKRAIAFIVISMFISTGLNLSIPLLSKHIMDDGFIGGNRKILVEMVLISLLVHSLDSFIDIVKEKKRIDISARLQYSLSEHSFMHLMKLRIDYYNSANYAEILNNITMDINQMASIADSSVFFVVTQIFSMTGGIIGLFIIDYRMTLLVLLFIPIKYIVMKRFAQKQNRMMEEYINEHQTYAKWFGDSVGGVREIRLFDGLRKKQEEFAANQNRLINKQKQMNMLGQWNMVTDTLMIQILTAVLYVIGANLVFDMKLSVGSVFAFITYSVYVTGPISAILNIGYLLSGIIPSTKRYYEFMELEEEMDQGTKTLHEWDDLRVENVSFGYDQERCILSNVNLTLKKGSKNALIGHNGSGKSTLINLLTRMYEPSEGRILLGQDDIKDFPISDYRNMISVVSQQVYLFDDTIRNNITMYGNVQEDDILQACKDSGLEAFIDEVTLDYVVGQNGMMLSGGQKQKIAMARALIHDRPIVILDEATSNTDSYSEQQINNLLYTRLKDKTVIIITHKKEVLSEMDNVIILRDGKVINQGAYSKLACREELDSMLRENCVRAKAV